MSGSPQKKKASNIICMLDVFFMREIIKPHSFAESPPRGRRGQGVVEIDN